MLRVVGVLPPLATILCRAVCFSFFILHFSSFAVAQTTAVDTLALPTIPAENHFEAKGLILPVTLVAAGTAGLFEPVKSWKYDLQDAVHTLGGQDQYPFEDYVQYVPAVTALSLGWMGVEARHNTLDRLMLSGTSYIVTASLTWALLKRNVVSIRPGIHYTYVAVGNADAVSPQTHPKYFNSFPSGHSATAFMGAELVRLEYGEEYPWLAVGAYAVAAGVGVMRIYHDYHWATDVLAGAGMGILGARLGWWLLPYEQRLWGSLFKREMAIRPQTNGYQTELAFTLTF